MKSSRDSTKSKLSGHKKLSVLIRFYLYSLHGITLDVGYFAIMDSLIKGEVDLVGRAHVIVMPAYGIGFLLMEWVSSYLKRKNVSIYIRGLMYTFMGYSFEFTTGYFLWLIGQDYWDYSDFSYNFKGIIIPHSAPAWYLLGLAGECFIIDGIKRMTLVSK